MSVAFPSFTGVITGVSESGIGVSEKVLSAFLCSFCQVDCYYAGCFVDATLFFCNFHAIFGEIEFFLFHRIVWFGTISVVYS